MNPRVCLAVIWLVVGCRERAEVRDGAREQSSSAPSTTPVEPGEVDARGMVGVVVPRREVRLATDTIARIREVDAELGDRVEAGAALVVLDDTLERGELRSAQASVRAAEAEARRLALQAQHSSSEVERARKLGELLPATEIDKLRHEQGSAALGSKRAGADAAERKAQADLIASRIERSILRAPFAGVVVERFADPGAVVAPGEAILHVISDDVVVRFAAPEAELPRLAVGAPIEVELPDLGLRVATTVETVAPEIDSATRIVMIEATVPLSADARARVLAGTRARVRAAAAQASAAATR